ncbi:MAG: type II secretion system protein [Candidatus Nanopelagicales bacterium]|jgi:prepilin-type N-terminal cleavage/methylation domain-containing protein
MRRFLDRRVLGRLGRDDDGVTLVELIVTMVVLGLLTGALVLMASASMRVSSNTKERMDQSNSAQIAMERVSRNLRTAVLQSQLTTTCTLAICTESAFLKGTPTTVQFYADVDNPKNSVGPSRVTYDVTGGVLTETVQKPDSPTPDAAGYHYCTSGPGCVIRTTVLATDVSTATAVFSFYTAADPTNAIALTTGQQLSAAQLKAVDSIDVAINVQRAGGANVAGASMVQRVALPNADSVVRTDGT